MSRSDMETNSAPEFVVLIGLPGSGKSTYIESLQEEKDYEVVSTDAIFEQKALADGTTYNQAFSTYPYKDVEHEMFVNMKDALSRRANIIVDQTNMTVKSRARKLSLVPKGYIKTAIIFLVDVQELQRRLKNRELESGKSIPDHVITSMRTSFQAPSTNEGFDEIVVIDWR